MAMSPLWLVAVALFVLGHLLPMDREIMILTPALLPIILFGSREVSLIVRLLELPPLQAVGLCSYSLYLWQQLFLGRPEQYAQPLPLALLPAVVALSYFVIEQPCARLGHRLSATIKSRAGGQRSPQVTGQTTEAPPV
jgi:peptidoglycan/LPS O-acetylase OafA/YrhL